MSVQTGTAPARFTRPLMLAKPQRPSVAPPPSPEPTEAAARAALLAAFASHRTPDEILARSSGALGRVLRFDCSAAYEVDPASPDRLTLLASEGLPLDFRETARTLPLGDFADVADLPYNEHCRPCYGDFFAPVAASYGMRSWLVAAVKDSASGLTRGAVLLGSRQPERLGPEESAALLALVALISEELSVRFPRR